MEITNSGGLVHAESFSFARLEYLLYTENGGIEELDRDSANFTKEKGLNDYISKHEAPITGPTLRPSHLGEDVARGDLVLTPSESALIVLDRPIKELILNPSAANLSDQASPSLTVVDDGTMPSMPGSSSRDMEGICRTKMILVAKGSSKQRICSIQEAATLGLNPTGHANRTYPLVPAASPSNLFIQGGGKTPSTIVSGVDKGIIAKAVEPIVTPQSGTLLFRNALLVRHGEVVCTIRRIGVQVQEPLLKSLDEVGSDHHLINGSKEVFPSQTLICPTLRFSGVTYRESP